MDVSDQYWITFKERIDLMLQYERQLTDERFQSRDESLRLQAVENERRLENLNGAHERLERFANSQVQRKEFDLFKEAHTAANQEVRERLVDLESSREATRVDTLKWIGIASILILGATFLFTLYQQG